MKIAVHCPRYRLRVVKLVVMPRELRAHEMQLMGERKYIMLLLVCTARVRIEQHYIEPAIVLATATACAPTDRRFSRITAAAGIVSVAARI